MKAEEIKAIINAELVSEPDIENELRIDFTQCLLEPIKQKYKDSNDAIDVYELWTVFEERQDKNGYKIFFDEVTKTFGLAINSDSDVLINIDHYGSFVKTLYLM